MFHASAEVVFEGVMDHDEFALRILLKQRHADMLAEARRRSLLQQRQPRPPLRVALGTTLIRVGAWLMRESPGIREGALRS
jgi:hypothetical protein